MTRLASFLVGVAALLGAFVPRTAVAQPCVSCWTDKCSDMAGYLEPCEAKKPAAKPPKQPEWPRKNKVTCPPGQVVTADTNGKCCWAGQFWENGACWGKPSACPPGKVPGAQACVDAPATPVAAPPAPVAGNASVRRAGAWNLHKDTTGHLYAWTDGGLAIELHANSNGWWQFADGSAERSIYYGSDGNPGRVFYARPWTKGLASGGTFSSSDSLDTSGSNGATRFTLEGGKLVGTLTDKGRVEAALDASLVEFVNSGGKRRTIYSGSGGAVAAATTGVDRSTNTVYGVGDWLLYRRPDRKDLYLWNDRAQVGVELIADSIGWWRWRDGATEQTIFTSGNPSSGGFYEKPWTRGLRQQAAFGAGTVLETSGQYGITKVEYLGGRLVATVTGGGRLDIGPSGGEVVFTNKSGSSFTFKGSSSAAGSVASAPAPAGTFGTPGVAYRLGSWTLMQTSGSDRTFVWYGSGTPSSVFEVTTNSNGWWRVKDAGTEKVVWVSGSADPQPLAYNKPWEGTVPPPLTVSSGSFDAKGSYGTSTFSWDGSRIRATLTTKATIEADASSPLITYRGADGKVTTFSAGVAPQGAPVVAAADAAGATMRHGGWTIHRPAGTRHLYAWYAGNDVALEVLGDMSGWWRWHTTSKEMNIFTALEPSVASFGSRPWQAGAAATQAFAPFTIPGTSGPTVATKSGSTVSFELSDHGVVSIDEGSPVIQYRGPSGQRRTYYADGSITKDGAAPSSAPATPTAGTVSAGVWTIHKASDGNVYVWNMSNGMALELVANSNGWWQFRDDKGAEKTVYFADETGGESVLYARPWTKGVSASGALGSGAVVTTGQYGETRVSVSGGNLVAHLTDKGYVEAALDGSRIEFVNSSAKRRTIWSGAATTVAAAPASASGGTFTVGRLTGVGGAGQKDVYVWTSGGASAAYFSADSNGWFKWRSGGREYVVYSDGSFETDTFTQRPWTGVVTASGGSASFSLSGSRGPTVFASAGGKLRVTLPAGGVVEIDTSNGQGSFVGAGGRTVSLP